MSLPTRRYLTMRPQEERNLSEKAKVALALLPDCDKLYQTKHDGCSIQILVGVNVVRIISREGKDCLSMPHIAEHFRVTSPPNMVYFGEAWHPDMEFKDISGMFRRQRPQPELQAWLFDAVTLQEYRVGESERPFALRQKALKNVLDYEAKVFPVLADPVLERVQARAAQFQNDRKFRLDGFIQRNVNAGWVAGIDNAGHVLKLKNHISVDLECVGVVEGEGKFKGMIGALEVMWRGQRVQVSGGKLTTKERQAYWDAETAPKDDRHDREQQIRLVTSIVEVHALDITPDGKLREPRFQRIRTDKTEPSE